MVILQQCDELKELIKGFGDVDYCGVCGDTFKVSITNIYDTTIAPSLELVDIILKYLIIDYPVIRNFTSESNFLEIILIK